MIADMLAMLDSYGLLNTTERPDLASLKVMLIGLPITLLSYGVALGLYRLGRQSPLLNPVLLGIGVTIGLLALLQIPYERYFEGAKVIHFLLGTATVALAAPLYHQLQHLRGNVMPVLVAIVVGSLVAAVASVTLAQLLGASTETLLSLLPKSTTTPVAMGIAERLGGLPALAAVSVIVTGIFGAIGGLPLLRRMGIHDHRTQGIALGVAAHGVGTARAFQLDLRLGAWSGLAMGLGAVVTSIIAPVLWWAFQSLP